MPEILDSQLPISLPLPRLGSGIGVPEESGEAGAHDDLDSADLDSCDSGESLSSSATRELHDEDAQFAAEHRDVMFRDDAGDQHSQRDLRRLRKRGVAWVQSSLGDYEWECDFRGLSTCPMTDADRCFLQKTLPNLKSELQIGICDRWGISSDDLSPEKLRRLLFANELEDLLRLLRSRRLQAPCREQVHPRARGDFQTVQ